MDDVRNTDDARDASVAPAGASSLPAATPHARSDGVTLVEGAQRQSGSQSLFGKSPSVRSASRQDAGSPNGRGSGAAQGRRGSELPGDIYGALDLGTNNCRLLLAKPSRRGFRVVDAFSRIIRLGEGVSQSGRLSPAAMARTMDALRVCADKLARSQARRSRLVATEACRIAENGPEFLAEVRERLGLDIEILTRETEARLAVSGCVSLIDTSSDYALVFDIGGGSSELIWLDLTRTGRSRERTGDRIDIEKCLAAWTSLPVGVVTLAERFGGQFVTADLFEAMVDFVTGLLADFEREHGFAARIAGRSVHLLGTSGTVTTVAGIRMGLPRYDRNRVDGCWMSVSDAREVTYRLLAQTYEQRIAEPCIGRDRADLVLAGCAILEAVTRMWPSERLRVADRGLREGILSTLMYEDGVFKARRRRSGKRRRR
ncbi:MAG: Ppx/GppA phosphatase family protein [Hyphomicrobiaceae bacterium]|nr:Ppx/GppA phosphatase family protein [Hyphomicrobiaceae bacterium]